MKELFRILLSYIERTKFKFATEEGLTVFLSMVGLPDLKISTVLKAGYKIII
ncbi:hypothetical protein [Enterococcus phage 156]|nr:hypothetical protein [Enterococcus phage 156]VDB76926.1 hypothetical protein PHI156_137 [Enterococcus phage 156]